jgi:hypothetical protein
VKPVGATDDDPDGEVALLFAPAFKLRHVHFFIHYPYLPIPSPGRTTLGEYISLNLLRVLRVAGPVKYLTPTLAQRVTSVTNSRYLSRVWSVHAAAWGGTCSETEFGTYGTVTKPDGSPAFVG